MPLHPNVVSYYARAGYRLELVVIEALEDALATLGIADVRLSRVHSGAPYDIELIIGGRRAFIEVKGANDEDRLQWKVNRVFRREHPEPFCVIGVIGYLRNADVLMKSDRGWIWVKPEKEGKLGRFGPMTLRRWLKKESIV